MTAFLSDMSYEELLCHAFKHRWIPHSALAGVAAGARVWNWQLECETGCGSSATEWRDDYGFRLPGTTRKYHYTESYRRGNGLSQGEYISEIRRRLMKGKKRAAS